MVYGQEYRPEGRSVTYESETLETIEPEVELTAVSGFLWHHYTDRISPHRL